jgi:WD40 repeat protein
LVSLAFSPDGKALAAAHGPVRLIDVATGKDLWRVESESHIAVAVAVSPDGRLIASGDLNGTVHLWDRQGGREIQRFQESPGSCYSLAFSPGGKYLAGTSAGVVLVWDVATGKLLYRLPGRSNYLPRLDFSPDGKEFVVAWFYEAKLQFRDPRTGAMLRTWDAAEENCLSPRFSPDGKLMATTGTAGVIRLRDRDTGTLVCSLRGNDPEVWGMAFAPDGKRLAATTGRSGTVFVWDTATGKRLSTLAGHDHAVTALAFSRDGRNLFSYGADGRLLTWDWAAGRERFLFRASTGMSGGASVLGPDAAVLVTHGDGVAHCWDFRRGTDAKELGRRLMSAWESPPALSLNGHLLAAAQHETAIFVGNPATGEEVRVLKGHDKPASGFTWVSGLAFAPDGRTLASTSADNTVRLWDAPTGKLIRIWKTGNGNNMRLAFAPDGKTLAVGEFYSGESIRLWDVASAKELTPPMRHGACLKLAFSADGRLLATGGNDDILKVWETAT